jgi:hypothetical protein
VTERRPKNAFLPPQLTQVVSGGQTGVDRAALDTAIELGIPHGGWCPRGRLAEDGVIPEHYELKELASSDYAARTRRNVADSDGTLVLYFSRLQGGTFLTASFARQLSKPCLKLDLATDPDSWDQFLSRLARWRHDHAVKVLNVAGPRASKSPEAYDLASRFLKQAIAQTP